MDGQSAPDVAATQLPMRFRKPPQVTWLVHAGLIIGAAALTARGWTTAVTYLGTAVGAAAVLAACYALVVAVRARVAFLFLAAFTMMGLGAACMTARGWVADALTDTLLSAAACVLFFGSAAALFVQTRRIRRGATPST